MKKKATSMDVAKLAGVSQSAVSSILNYSNRVSFSEETRARVFNAARELGYRLPTRSISGKNANTVLVLVPTLSNQYYVELGWTLESYADSLGLKAIVCSTFRKSELEKYYLELFMGMGVAGIIYTFLPSFPQLVNDIDARLPVILIGGKEESLSICSIELSDAKSSFLLAEHLYDLGHRQFAFISTPIKHTTLARRQRLEGLQNALRSLGLPKDALQVMVVTENSAASEVDDSVQPYEYIVGQQLTHALIDQGSRATAIVAVNDMTAIGVLAALRAKGYTVPEDYSVCGFDNVFVSSITCPPITTIDHQMSMRCHAALDMVLARLKTDTAATITMADRIEYSPKLIIRESTGKARV